MVLLAVGFIVWLSCKASRRQEEAEQLSEQQCSQKMDISALCASVQRRMGCEEH